MSFSLLRKLEYKKISKLNLSGKVLDLGGSKKSGYHQLIKGNHEITTVNINTDYLCDLVFDIEEKFPLEDNAFDHVMLINVLEHIYNFKNVISESNRVLKSDGKIYLAVPFIHQIHGSPNDFFRYSKSTLNRLLLQSDFKNIKIEELGFDFFSLGYQMFFIGVIPSSFFKKITKNFLIFLDKFILKFSSCYRQWAKNNPMGYWVEATKN